MAELLRTPGTAATAARRSRRRLPGRRAGALLRLPCYMPAHRTENRNVLPLRLLPGLPAHARPHDAGRQRPGAVHHCGWTPMACSHPGAPRNSLELAIEMSFTSFGSSQTFLRPQSRTEAASLFCSLRATCRAARGSSSQAHAGCRRWLRLAGVWPQSSPWCSPPAGPKRPRQAGPSAVRPPPRRLGSKGLAPCRPSSAPFHRGARAPVNVPALRSCKSCPVLHSSPPPCHHHLWAAVGGDLSQNLC